MFHNEFGFQNKFVGMEDIIAMQKKYLSQTPVFCIYL